MKCVTRTHIGNVRSSNQDALLVQAPLFGVADGMGGHKAGDIASRMAVLLLARVLEGAHVDERLLEGAIEEVNDSIYNEQLNNQDYNGMGTTVTVLWEDNDYVLLGHVGDSRAYLKREGILKQISEDHSMVNEMIKQGILTKESAETYPYKNVITRAVGTDPHVMVDIYRVDKQKGDQWVICSDGLTGFVSDAEIEHTLKVLPLEEAADLLLQRALDEGGNDNISFVLLEVPR